MALPNRRQLLSTSLAAGTSVGISHFHRDNEARPKERGQEDEPTQDQAFVMEAGLTREEAECWKLTAEAAGSFFGLPKLHPSDAAEVAQAIHIIQNKLLGRPTYRKYMELAKSAAQEKE